jgi:hypothetical protein
MKKIYFFSILMLLNSSSLFSQVSINANGNPPDPSAGLDVSFTNKGFLLPRMSFEQRNMIQNPAEGLIIYCTNCNTDASGALTVFQGGLWRMFNLNCFTPNTPPAGTNVPAVTQIFWDWNAVPIAEGYKWNTVNDYYSARDLGMRTDTTETGLTCWTPYTRYVWAYNSCGQSVKLTLNQSTSPAVFSPAPTAGAHASNTSMIGWTWNYVTGATGYRWGITNDFNAAQDMGNYILRIETGLACNTSYTRYVWAYDGCGYSTATTLTFSTTSVPPSAPVAAAHVPFATQIVWNWNTVSGASGYRWNTTNDSINATDIGNVTSHTETGLTCNTPQTSYVWAYNNCGVSHSTTLSQTTSLDPPAAPVAATHVAGPAQIVWNWNAVSGATGYRWNTNNDSIGATDIGNVTTKTETGLTCNTPQTSYVWAYSSCGVSIKTTLTKTTSLDPPAAPVAATHVPGPTQIIWNWNAVSGATSYRWNTANDSVGATDIGNVTTKTETGLTCNTPQTSYVWACSSCGVSIKTTLTNTTSLDPPAAPVEAAHVPAPTQIVWNWNAVSGATSYRWNTTNDSIGATDIGNVTTKTETGLTCNTAQTSYVWACNTCGVSLKTTLTKNTSLDPPASPVAANHVPFITQIIWNWYGVTGATGYRWNTTNDSVNAIDIGNITTYTETGLTCNTPQTSYIWAYNPCGVSIKTCLTKSTSVNPPSAPVAATHTASPYQIIWNWNTVSGATGYRWSTTNDSVGATDIGNVTTKTETGLTCNTAQTSYVWAYSGCGVSTSTTLTKSTTTDPPAAPVASTHTPGLNQIVWNWNAVTGATGYRWNTDNDSVNATDIGNVITKTETGLPCNSPQTSYVWAYGACGVSLKTTLTQATSANPPAAPVAATHLPGPAQIIWNWNTVSGATGYRWNTTNDSVGATDLGNVTTKTETGLPCNTPQTSYVWAYGSCGVSTSTSLTQTTSLSPPATPVAATHTPSSGQIIWNWNAVTGATGYRWNTTNDSVNATDIGNVTSQTETGLTCNTLNTSYVWAYSNCGVSTPATLTQSTTTDPPSTPTALTHVPSITQIVWNWNPVTGATGYKWYSTNDSINANDLGNLTTYTETGLTCNSAQTCYVWAYSDCGVSSKATLTANTLTDPPATPGAATHVASYTQIIWKWHTVAAATGYRWSSTNDFSSATEMNTDTTKTETGLTCGSNYTRYAWAYNSCGHSTAVTLTKSTLACWTCGSSLVIDHEEGDVCPVDKEVTYSTVTNIPGETSKCWITSNLGADHQATAKNDATEPSAGWYWQFNRMQGYKHDGTTLTPAWTITSINEPDSWLAANDPCTLELGTGWRLPTYTEWENVDAATGWSSLQNTWDSALKLHAAGNLSTGSGAITFRGTYGYYWASTASSYTFGWYLKIQTSSCGTSTASKATGYTVRCIK